MQVTSSNHLLARQQKGSRAREAMSLTRHPNRFILAGCADTPLIEISKELRLESIELVLRAFTAHVNALV